MIYRYGEKVPQQKVVSITNSDNTDVIACLERAAEIKLQGLMAHSEWMHRVHKWGYQGFKRWHKSNFKFDTKANLMIESFLIDHYRYEIPRKEVKPVFETPDTVKGHFAKWIEFEEMVIKELSSIAIWLFDNGYLLASCMIGKLAKGAEEEKMRVKRVQDELDKCDYNEMQIFEISKQFHEFYSKNKKNKKIYP